MNKGILEQLIDQGYTQIEIAIHQNAGQSTVRYWLKKFNLKTKLGPHGRVINREDLKFACKCGEIDPNKFYGHKTSICSKCHNTYNLDKGRAKRRKAIELLGGECKICGFKEFTCSLDIHHLNPSKKDPNFQTMRYWKWEKIVKELKTCILLCKNHHAALHAGKIQLSEIGP